MAQDFAPDDDEINEISDREVARLVLALDREITRSRCATALHQIVEGQTVRLTVKPSRIELAVLTTLADVRRGAVATRLPVSTGRADGMWCRGRRAARVVW